MAMRKYKEDKEDVRRFKRSFLFYRPIIFLVTARRSERIFVTICGYENRDQ